MNLIRIALLLSFVLPGATPAKEACFCLEDDVDNFRHSCEMQQQGFRQIVHCLDDAGEPYRVDDLRGWRQLAEGEGRCDPCKPLKTRTEGPIRGNEDDERTPGTANERAE